MMIPKRISLRSVGTATESRTSPTFAEENTAGFWDVSPSDVRLRLRDESGVVARSQARRRHALPAFHVFATLRA